MRHPVRAAALATAAVVLAACSDKAPLTAPTSPAADVSSAVSAADQDDREAERYYVELSARYPEFAGYHIDDAGNFVVSTTGAAGDSALQAEMVAYARTLPISAHEHVIERKVILQRVKHSYRKLAQIREKLERDLTDPDVAFFDLTRSRTESPWVLKPVRAEPSGQRS